MQGERRARAFCTPDRGSPQAPADAHSRSSGIPCARDAARGSGTNRAVTPAAIADQLPHPPGFLPVVTGIITIFLGALGGWLRSRHDRRERLAAHAS